MRRSRSAAPASRSLRAWAASVSPCSIRDLRWPRMFAIGLKANIQIRARKKTKLRAATMTQKKLMESPGALLCVPFVGPPLLGRNRVVVGGRSDRLGQWVVGAFEHHRAFREIAGMRRLVLFLAMPFDGHDLSLIHISEPTRPY